MRYGNIKHNNIKIHIHDVFESVLIYHKVLRITVISLLLNCNYSSNRFFTHIKYRETVFCNSIRSSALITNSSRESASD